MGKKVLTLPEQKSVGYEQPVSVGNVPILSETNDKELKFDINRAKQQTDLSLLNPRYRDRYSKQGGKNYTGASPLDPSPQSVKGENQSGWSKTFNNVIGNALSIATKLGTQFAEVGGGLYDISGGPGQLALNKTLYGNITPHLFENGLTKFLGNVEQEITQNIFPVHGGQAYYSDSLWKQMGDGKMWAEAGNAAAFTIASYIPMAMAGRVAKLMKIPGAVGKVREFTGPARLFTYAATTTWNTVQEAALEGDDTQNQTRESVALRDYNTEYQFLDSQQKLIVDKAAGEAAAKVFVSNLGVLGLSNLMETRFFMGPAKSRTAKLLAGVRSGKVTPKSISTFKNVVREMGYGAGSQGPWEEGMQSAVSRYEKNKAEGKDVLKRIPGYAFEWVNNFYDTEGKKSMFLGTIIGMGMGGYSGVAESLGKKEVIRKAEENWKDKILNKLPGYDKSLIPEYKKAFKTFKDEVTIDGKTQTVSSILDKDNNTHIDHNITTKALYAHALKKELMDELTFAVLNNDEVHEKFILTQLLSQYFYEYASNIDIFPTSQIALDTLLERSGLKDLAEDSELKELGYDYDYMANKVKQIKEEWDKAEKTIYDKKDLTNDDKEALKFKKILAKGLLYENMKLKWLDEIESEVEDKEQLDKLRADTNELIDIMSDKSKRGELLKEYKKTASDEIELQARLD